MTVDRRRTPLDEQRLTTKLHRSETRDRQVCICSPRANGWTHRPQALSIQRQKSPRPFSFSLEELERRVRPQLRHEHLLYAEDSVRLLIASLDLSMNLRRRRRLSARALSVAPHSLQRQHSRGFERSQFVQGAGRPTQLWPAFCPSSAS